jgi:dihydrofolate reductase
VRKIVLFNMVSLDGLFEGRGRDINWHQTDEEFNQFANEQLSSAGGLIFGRVTYEGMASYWPTPLAIENDPFIAHSMNSLPKIVFSRTLEKADWNNSRLIRDDVVKEIATLKQEPGKDFLLFGSGDLAATFIEHDLIDEYRIMVNPVVLGSGTPLFKRQTNPLHLQLLNTRTFDNGNVLLYYQPDRTER